MSKKKELEGFAIVIFPTLPSFNGPDAENSFSHNVF